MKKLLTVILLMATPFNGGLAAVAAQDLASVEPTSEIIQAAPATESDQTPSAIDDHQLDEDLSESLATATVEQAISNADETSNEAIADPQASESLTEESLPLTESTQPPLELTDSTEEPFSVDTEAVDLLEPTESTDSANLAEGTDQLSQRLLSPPFAQIYHHHLMCQLKNRANIVLCISMTMRLDAHSMVALTTKIGALWMISLQKPCWNFLKFKKMANMFFVIYIGMNKRLTAAG